MPTIIDSLLMTLGLDTSSFEAGVNGVGKGLKELEDDAKAAQKALDTAIKSGASGDTLTKLATKSNQAAGALKNVQNAAKGQAKETTNVTKSMAQFLAVIGGAVAIKSFIEHTIESSAALGRLSENLQTNVSTISAWSNATELAGGSAGGLQGTMDMLSRSQTELMLTGQSSLIPYFSALGVAMGNANGKARPLDDILLDLSDKFSKMDRTTANNMGRMMGIDQGTLQLLLKGRTEVEAMIRAQKEFGAVSSDQAQEAMRMEKAIKEGQQTFAAFGRELLHKAMPAIETLLEWFTKLTNWAKENSTFVLSFLTALTTALVGLAVATLPISGTVLAVVALSAAIAALYTEYQKWLNGEGTSGLIDWNKWGPGIKGAIDGLTWMKNLLADLFYRAFAAADAMDALAARDWKRLKFAAGEVVAGNGQEYLPEEKPKTNTAGQAAIAAASSMATGKPQPGQAIQQYAPQPGQPAAQQAAPKGKAETAQAEQDAVNFFQKLGWTMEQSAGIVANIKKESGFNNKAVGDSGQAYGLAQWHPDRQAEFQKRYGKPIQGSSREEQMAFINYELTMGKEQKAGNKLRQASTAEQAAATVSTHYERPAATAKEANERAFMARNIAAGAQRQPAQPQAAATTPTQQAVPVSAPVAAKPAESQLSPVKSTVTNVTQEAQGAIKQAAPAVGMPLPPVPKPEQNEAGIAALLAGIARAITTMMQFMMTQADGKKTDSDKQGGRNEQKAASPFSMFGGIPGAAMAAQGAGAAQMAQSSAPGTLNQQSNQASTVTTNIGTIQVHTAATDAQGMAKDLANSQNWAFLSQANNGMA